MEGLGFNLASEAVVKNPAEMFYDLNLGVDMVGEQTRREMVAMAMQLGSSGVAANHNFIGIMADSDRCKLRPLELRTLVSAAPGVAQAARFHRGLLGVPVGLPFRQFTRITVVVESAAQVNALNSGNPVLKTYDILAARPTNQQVFGQVCRHSEVDLITLDLSQKFPFRPKMPILKAATERGIYFEISYGRSILTRKPDENHLQMPSSSWVLYYFEQWCTKRPGVERTKCCCEYVDPVWAQIGIC